MTEPPALGTGARLNFMAPLSAERASRLVAELAAPQPLTVIDLGCGWGELLLRIAAVSPQTRAIGVEVHGPDIVRGRANAEALGLASRVTFKEGAAAEHLESADVLLSVGAYQAFGAVGDALRVFHDTVTPGGRVLFGAEFWERPPTPDRLEKMWPATTEDDCTDLAGLVDAAVAAGFRPLHIETATTGEWDEFESGLAAELEEWLLTYPRHPQAAEVRARVDEQRSIWLRGHRGLMGFAYLTLGRAGG